MTWTYLNVNRADAHTQSILELAKASDVVFIAEPLLHKHDGKFNCSGLQNLRPASRIAKHTKLVAYVSGRVSGKAKITQNRAHTCILVEIGGARLCGVYLPGKDNMVDFEDDLEWIATKLRHGGQVAGDFNCPAGRRRRRVLEEWRAGMGLEPAFSNEATTFRRTGDNGVVTSNLDLIFASPSKPWTPGPLHLEFTGSDHCILSGHIASNAEQSELSSTDWEWWEDYVQRNPPHECPAYEKLVQIAQAHPKKIRITAKSKRWWDQDLREQVEVIRSTAWEGDRYKEERKKLRKMVRRKKREH